MAYSSYGPPRLRREHSDDSKSSKRSELTTTESSPACSTWDTFSSEPKSLPVDPPDGNVDEVSRPSESSEQTQEYGQTLVVKLPPEKPTPSKNITKLGIRRRSKSLEAIVLPKNTESTQNNQTTNGQVKNKVKNSLKSVLSSIKGSKRFLLANAIPISSGCLEPIPKTRSSKNIDPGSLSDTSQRSTPYVRQSVRDNVAAQSKRRPSRSKEIKKRTQFPENHTTPPPPAPSDPIVKVTPQDLYLTDCTLINNLPTEEDHVIEQVSTEEQRPTVKQVLFLDSNLTERESPYISEPTDNIRRFEPQRIASTSSGYENFDYDSLEKYETRHYQRENIKENRRPRFCPEVQKEFEEAIRSFRKQLEADLLIEQYIINICEESKRSAFIQEQYSKNVTDLCNDDYGSFIQPSSSPVRQQPQQDLSFPETYNREHRQQHSDQAELCSRSNDHHERRPLGQIQDRRSRQSQSRHIHPQDKQASQSLKSNLRSRAHSLPRERTSPNYALLSTERTWCHQQKLAQVAPPPTGNNSYNYETESNRPANSFWRRDLSHQVVLETPLGLSNCERKTKHFPQVNKSPSNRRKNSLSSEYINSEEFELHSYFKEQYYDLYRERRYTPVNKTHPRRPMGRMGSLEDHERKVIIEFCHLLEKSKQLFNGLRELPHYGHRQWHSYFGRTFDVYTKLWKFQQQHRGILDSKYGLKRWQIGEIASKIGQLYYHFYLRTSETAYLSEAYSFYSAIRGRSYYTKACKEDKCELMVKKLRYYARFIVVCLLLKKSKLVRELIKELDRQIIEYGNTYDPDDQIEWTVVVDEVKAFIKTEPIVTVIHPDSYAVLLSHRLCPMTTPPVERSQHMNLSLQEILIVGSSSQQVKFSELTMDMFRMMQTLEREPTGEIQHMYDDSPRQRFNLTPSALNNKGYNLEGGGARSDNPHKYLLFKPSPSQILVYLASGCNDLPPNGALLLYMSADGQISQPSKHPEDGYDIGGLITTSKSDLYKDKTSQGKNRDLLCFHPGDLYPFTRKPLFIIIDSENSFVFQNIPRHFGQPMVVLMSPVDMATGLKTPPPERRQQGSLFTLFLYSPLTAYCYCSDMYTVPLLVWDRAQAYIDTFLAEASQLVTRGRIDPAFLNFMGDDFLRLLILRYIFCELVLRMNKTFKLRTMRPRSSPSIPDEILEHPALVHIIFDLATHLQVRHNYQEPNGNLDRPSKE